MLAGKNEGLGSALVALSALDREKTPAIQAAVKNLARGEASIPSLEEKYLRRLGLRRA